LFTKRQNVGVILLLASSALCAASFVGGRAPFALDDANTLVQGILARSEALFSGEIKYHLKYGFANQGKVLGDEDWRFTFSGASWILQAETTGRAWVSHDGKSVELVSHPQKDGKTDYTASINVSKAVDSLRPCPPYFIGTLWYKSTQEFIRTNASSAKPANDSTINGVKAQVLEWDVPIPDISKAFERVAVSERLDHPGVLRLCVATQFGYALPRIEHLSRLHGEERDAVIDATDFHEVAVGIYVPKRCMYQAYDKAGAASYYEEYRVSEISKANDVIPDDVFRIVLPEGTSVTDARDPKKPHSFRVGKIQREQVTVIPADLENVIRVERPGGMFRSTVIATATGIAAGLVLLLAFLLFRRSYKKR
jgi:hypothetical protein